MDNMRALDNLGRIVIPSEIRKALNLREKELLHIFYNGQRS